MGQGENAMLNEAAIAIYSTSVRCKSRLKGGTHGNEQLSALQLGHLEVVSYVAEPKKGVFVSAFLQYTAANTPAGSVYLQKVRSSQQISSS